MELQGLQGVLLRGNTKKNNAKAQKTKLSVGGGTSDYQGNHRRFI